MEAFLSFILITALVLYLAGIVGKWLLRRWIARKQREFAERFGQQAGGFTGTYTWTTGGQRRSQDNTTKREGEIKVQRTQKQEKKVNGQIGDYVDFEEVSE